MPCSFEAKIRKDFQIPLMKPKSYSTQERLFFSRYVSIKAPEGNFRKKYYYGEFCVHINKIHAIPTLVIEFLMI